MKILYQMPSLDTIYAGRTIYHGYKNAFIDLGHAFTPLTANDNQYEVFEKINPDIFMTSLNSYNLKYLNLSLLKKYKNKGMKVFVYCPFWKSPISKLRINEAPGLENKNDYIDLIKSGDYGDIYYNPCEQGDIRMEGFSKETGYNYITIPLAADKISLNAKENKKFNADISFIGTYLPQKRKYFDEYLFPLKNIYDLKIFGQDWTHSDRMLGWVQRGGQYFNLPYLKSIRKPKLSLNDEGDIYKSSRISVNIHEDYQRQFGGDCNERTFKIPFCEGFEITDNVACIKKYFKEDEEIVIAKNAKDWFEKIDFFIKNPEKRIPIIEAGKNKVLNEHTYHNRAQQMINLK